MGAALSPLLDSQASTRDGMRQLPTVAQLLLLREVAPASHTAPRRHLLVANAHLYFSNPAMHVRLLQTAKLLDEMHAWAAQLRAQLPAAAAAPALIVAGDLPGFTQCVPLCAQANCMLA